MKLYQESITVQSSGLHPTFHDITEPVKEILSRSSITDGQLTVYSHHTTCSVMLQECSHDQTYFGLEFLQQDLCNILEALIPTCRVENQYLHPGPKHIVAGAEAGDPAPWCSLNTDAHLRSALLCRSESIYVEDGSLDLGQFGHVYFIDWDQVRARERTVRITVIGE